MMEKLYNLSFVNQTCWCFWMRKYPIKLSHWTFLSYLVDCTLERSTCMLWEGCSIIHIINWMKISFYPLRQYFCVIQLKLKTIIGRKDTVNKIENFIYLLLFFFRSATSFINNQSNKKGFWLFGISLLYYISGLYFIVMLELFSFLRMDLWYVFSHVLIGWCGAYDWA